MTSLVIGDIEIRIVKKNIKNLYLSVHPPDGSVWIAAPGKMNDEAIKAFALAKLSWIEKQRAKFQTQAGQLVQKFVSEEKHYYQGNFYSLNVLFTDKKQRVEITNDKYINLYVQENATQEQRAKVMTEWYRDQLKSQIPVIIEKWEKRIGVKVESWGVKLMRTKWGTCNPIAKRIWINLELIKKSPQYLEYIIVHEMVHFLERKHNQRFFAYLDHFLPHWRNIKQELKNH